MSTRIARTDKTWRPGSTLNKQNSAKSKKGKAAAWTQRDGSTLNKGATGIKTGTQVARKRVREEEKDQEDQGQDEVTAAAESSEEETVTPASKPAAKGKRQNRKTGGTGKKVKVFVEEKSDLLSLAAAITGQAEEKSKAKADRVKQKPALPPKDQKEPSKAKQQQMDMARQVVAQRKKQKKDSEKAEQAPPRPKLDDGKKRVSFA